MTTKISTDYSSFSGADMVCQLSFNGDKLKGSYIFGELTTLSYSSNTVKKPVRPIGRKDALGFTNGPRTFAGSLVFSVFDKYIGTRILEEIKPELSNQSILMDELPPFDITISMGNEYNQNASIAILGVTIVNEGQVMSINDITTENTYQFLATSVIPLSNYLKSVSYTDNNTLGNVNIDSNETLLKTFEYVKTDYDIPDFGSKKEKLFYSMKDNMNAVFLQNKEKENYYFIELKSEKDPDFLVEIDLELGEIDSVIYLDYPEGNYTALAYSSPSREYNQTIDTIGPIHFHIEHKKKNINKRKIQEPYFVPYNNGAEVFDISTRNKLKLYDENDKLINTYDKNHGLFIIDDLEIDSTYYAETYEKDNEDNRSSKIRINTLFENDDILTCNNLMLINYNSISSLIPNITATSYKSKIKKITERLFQYRETNKTNNICELFQKSLNSFKGHEETKDEYEICNFLFNSINKNFCQMLKTNNIEYDNKENIGISQIGTFEEENSYIVLDEEKKFTTYSNTKVLPLESGKLNKIISVKDNNYSLGQYFYKLEDTFLESLISDSISKQEFLKRTLDYVKTIYKNYIDIENIKEADLLWLGLFNSHIVNPETKYMSPIEAIYEDGIINIDFNSRYRYFDFKKYNICIQNLKSYLNQEPCSITFPLFLSKYVSLDENSEYVIWLQNEELVNLTIPNIIKFADKREDVLSAVFNYTIDILYKTFTFLLPNEKYLHEVIENLIDYKDFSITQAFDFIIEKVNANFSKIDNLQNTNQTLFLIRRQLFSLNERENPNAIFESISITSDDPHISKIVLSNPKYNGTLTAEFKYIKEDGSMATYNFSFLCEVGSSIDFSFDSTIIKDHSNLMTMNYLSNNLLKQSTTLLYDRVLKKLYTT